MLNSAYDGGNLLTTGATWPIPLSDQGGSKLWVATSSVGARAAIAHRWAGARRRGALGALGRGRPMGRPGRPRPGATCAI
eukprot:6194391-Pleurochrysis_carterae.AAC.3